MARYVALLSCALLLTALISPAHCQASDDGADDDASDASFSLSPFTNQADALAGLASVCVPRWSRSRASSSLPCVSQALEAGLKVGKVTGVEVVQEAMGRGWWDVVTAVVKAGRAQGVDLATAVHQSADVIRKKLQALTESLQGAATGQGCVTTLPPI